MTAFQDTVAGYKAGITDLNTYVHPYVVFGNDAPRSQKRLWTGKKIWRSEKEGWKTFDPTKYGVNPLSVMAPIIPVSIPPDPINQLITTHNRHHAQRVNTILCRWLLPVRGWA